MCLVKSHVSEPFHWAKRWDGTCFEQLDLNTIGMEVRLGHGGLRCPAVKPKEFKLVKVIDTNGFHEAQVVYCECCNNEMKSACIQLAWNGLLSASVKQPEIAFTFRCMEDFHLHTLTSRKTAFDYVKKLARKTDEITRKTHTVSRSFVHDLECNSRLMLGRP